MRQRRRRRKTLPHRRSGLQSLSGIGFEHSRRQRQPVDENRLAGRRREKIRRFTVEPDYFRVRACQRRAQNRYARIKRQCQFVRYSADD